MTAQNRLAGKVAIVTGMARVSEGPKQSCLRRKAPRLFGERRPFVKHSRGQRQTGLISRAEFKAPPANPLFFPH
jgi:hypothetical protein